MTHSLSAGVSRVANRNTPRIAACLVVQNAEARLGNCLARVAPFVDEILVADLSSTDRSAAIAREYGADVITFPATEPILSARQKCQQRVSADWILALEPSDLIPEEAAEQLRSELASEDSDTEFVEYSVENSGTASLRPIQLVRNVPGASRAAAFPVQDSTAAVYVDVIILSYAKTEKEYLMTKECIRSLRASEAHVRFNVVVVETNSAAKLRILARGAMPFDEDCKVVFPHREFNYNEFLQIGFASLKGSRAKYLLIANNDLIFQAGFAGNLLNGLAIYASVSPWCPGHHDQLFDPTQPFHVGFRTSHELCGWAIMFGKDLLDRIPFHQLFPTDFSFWFQDNYYGIQLQRIGTRHALVTTARVVHLFQQSHALIDSEKRTAMTHGMLDVFRDKVEIDRDPSNRVLLTIAVPSSSRPMQPSLAQLLERLASQAAGKAVEILSLVDNQRRHVGAKRNALTALAQGEYLTFLDDQADVSERYVDQLIDAIQSRPEIDGILFESRSSAEFESRELLTARGGCFRTSLLRTYLQTIDGDGINSDWIEHLQPHCSRVVWAAHGLCSDELTEASSAQPTVASVDNSKPVLLTVGILSISERVRAFLPQIVQKLSTQAGGKPVELLVLIDNRRASIGAKRNAILNLAQGRFVTFVDDDDDVADEYIDALLNAIEQGGDRPDCIVFDAWVTVGGGDGRLCRYGTEFDDQDLPNVFLRRPNHICCIRTELARATPFEDLNWQEDFRWAAAIVPHLRKQVRIEKILYHYRYNPKTSAAAAPQYLSTVARHENPAEREREAVCRATADTPVGRFSSCERTDPIDQWPIFGFMHVAMVNHWRSIVEEQLLKLRVSGLWDRTVKLFVGLLGPGRERFDFPDDKIEVIYHSPDLREAEFPTLEFLEKFCRSQNCLVYYLHTKGVFHISPQTTDWRRLMEHFMIVKHEDCIRTLVDQDACGVNWDAKHIYPHFSGNFWWARADYIRRLPFLRSLKPDLSQSLSDRHICEWWIGEGVNARMACLHHSQVNHYQQRYARSRYARLREITDTEVLHCGSAWRGLENRFQDLLEPVEPLRLIVGLGAEDGYSLFAMATAAPQATVLGIDLDEEQLATQEESLRRQGYRRDLPANVYRAWLRTHLASVPNVMLWEMDCAAAAAAFVGQIDVLHLDTSVSYDSLRNSFELWEPKVRPGGCVLFHDTTSLPYDIGRFFRELPGRKIEIRESFGLGAWYKDHGIHTTANDSTGSGARHSVSATRSEVLA